MPCSYVALRLTSLLASNTRRVSCVKRTNTGDNLELSWVENRRKIQGVSERLGLIKIHVTTRFHGTRGVRAFYV